MITPRQAGLIKRLTAAADRPGELRNILDRASRQIPGTVQYFYSIGGGSRGTLDHHRHWRRTIILDAVNELVGGYGVEALGPRGSFSSGGSPRYEYVNMGDTYATTLIYRTKTDNLFIGDWGSIVEREDRAGRW